MGSLQGLHKASQGSYMGLIKAYLGLAVCTNAHGDLIAVQGPHKGLGLWRPYRGHIRPDKGSYAQTVILIDLMVVNLVNSSGCNLSGRRSYNNLQICQNSSSISPLPDYAYQEPQ